MIMPDLKRLMGIFRDEVGKVFDGRLPFDSDIDVNCWVQTWPNTGGGMAESGYMYGQAITREVVTCFVCRSFQIAMVCFGNQAAYICDLSEKFWNDFYKQQIVGISQREVYHDIMDSESEEI